MLIWTAVAGAFVGWTLRYYQFSGAMMGGLVGLIVGWRMQRTIRSEVAKEVSARVADAMTPLAVELDRQPAVSRTIAAPLPQHVTTPVTTRRAETPPAISEALAQQSTPTEEPAVPLVAAPDEPNALESALGRARDWLLGGNTIVRVGLAVLFVGLSFLVRWVASAGLLPIEVRLALVGAAGIALLVVGFRTRSSRPGFGLALQGGGIATIYLTLFAAARLFDTVPVTIAFALMIVICALGCALALLQGSQALAATAFVGGFAVPLLLSEGGGSIASVFAYYTILNLAILFIATRRAWRGLNLVGFAATFGIAAPSGAISYEAADFAMAQGFLVANVLIYVAMGVLYTRATPGKFGHVVDTTLLFGPALAGFGFEAGLVHDRPFGTAFAALAFAALYLGMAFVTARYRRESYRVMNEAMLAIGVGFITLAVPLALGARWTSSAWALEGAGALWVGMRQARWMPRLFGLVLQTVAAIVFIGSLSPIVVAPWPLAHEAFVGAVLIAVALITTSWWLRNGALPHSASVLARNYAELEDMLGKPLFLFGFAFWWGAWALEVQRALPVAVRGEMPVEIFGSAMRALLMMLAYVLSAWIAQHISRRLRWDVAAWPSLASLAALVFGFFGEIDFAHMPSSPGWPIWIVAIAVHLHMLYRNDVARPDRAETRWLVRSAHIGGVWLGTAMLADTLWYVVDRAALWETSWAGLVFQASGVAVLIALTFWTDPALRGRAARWPIAGHAADYGWHAAAPIAALVFAGAVLAAWVMDGQVAPLPYVPLLNPVDLTLALSLAALALWRRTVLSVRPLSPGATRLEGPGALVALGGLAFVIVNAAWLRAAHHLLGVAWSPDVLMENVVVQTGLAILWTLIALGLMVAARRRVERLPWLIGAGLLALTVVKLLLVDLGAAGGGARIVAFIAVGVLMLVVGYAAPLPPKDARHDGAVA